MTQRARVVREVIDRFGKMNGNVNYDSEAFKARLTSEIVVELERLEDRRFVGVMDRLNKDAL